MMNKQMPGIIFDLDGTLANTLEDITDGVNYAMKQVNKPELSISQVRSFVGNGILTLMGRAANCTDEDQCRTLVDHFKTWYHANLLNKTHLYDGIPELLDRLTELDVPMAILSNKPHQLTRQIGDGLLDRWPFIEVRGDSDQFPRKPDPASALHQVKLLNRSTEDMIFIGDSEVDSETAQAAGIRFIGVSWGFRDPDALLDAGVNTLIKQPSELLDALE